MQGTPPLTMAEVYAAPVDKRGVHGVTPAQIATLVGSFRYTYEQARAFTPDLAEWFLELRQVTGY